MHRSLIALLGLALLPLIAGCANSSKQPMITEVKTSVRLPPDSLMHCPKPKLDQCRADQDCIAENAMSVGGAWRTCYENSQGLKKWRAQNNPKS